MSEAGIRLLLSSGQQGPAPYEEALVGLGARCVGGYCPRPCPDCHGLVLCGGGDVDPALFGQKLRGAAPPDRARDRCELALVRAFLKAGKPILGVCRGMQVLNIALGGDLIQDLPAHVAPFHADGVNYLAHPVRAAEDCLFARLYGPVFPVNSWHHQAMGRLGRGLAPLLWSEGGVVEGVAHETLPLLGVQFHPERMTGSRSRTDTVDGGPILAHFLDLCR